MQPRPDGQVAVRQAADVQPGLPGEAAESAVSSVRPVLPVRAPLPGGVRARAAAPGAEVPEAVTTKSVLDGERASTRAGRSLGGVQRQRRSSVSAEPPRQLDVEGVEVDVGDPVEEFGRAAVLESLGQRLAPLGVFGLESLEDGDSVGPLLGPRPSVLRALVGPDGLGGCAALPESALALGVGHRHEPQYAPLP